jgi:hypothetical protein
MSTGNDPQEERQKRRIDQGIPNEEKVSFQAGLVELMQGGYLHSEPVGEFPEADLPSTEEERQAAQAVRQRLLAKLGLESLPSYMTTSRESKGLSQGDVAKSCKLAREVIVDLERGALPFYQLLVKQAADLVQALEAEPSIVFYHLTHLDLGSSPAATISSSFYRQSKPPTEESASKINPTPAAYPVASTSEKLNRFMIEFREELSKRGLV